jgi:hypothetical protein
MTTHARSGFQILLAIIAALALTGCFTSLTFFKEQRIWDPTWAGRYEGANGAGEYVVLAADPASRSYLIAWEREEKELMTGRGALYPGWDDVFILGNLPTRSTVVNYHLVRRITKDRIEFVTPSCEGEKDAKGNDPCIFTSLDALRKAVRPAYAAALAKAKSERVPLIERMKTTPPSWLGTATVVATFEDGDGVHGALRIAPNAPRPAGMNATDLIIAVNGYESTAGGALQLFIAHEKPGTKLRLTLLDPKTNARRDIAVTTVALPAS